MTEAGMQKRISDLADELGRKALGAQVKIATAESCTAGGISWAITQVPGSSSWFDRGFVVYTARAKCEMLGVDPSIIEKHGVVSEQTAQAMASGALEHAEAALSVSVTGIAGPGGAEPGKPVGTVCFGFARKNGKVCSETVIFSGNRSEVREQAVAHALTGLLQRL